MFRIPLLGVVAALVVATPVAAKRAPTSWTPIQKLVTADVIVVGKVTAIEKGTVDAAPFPGAALRTYQVAVIKIESGFVGAANTTHVKVGFLSSPDGTPANLTEGKEGLFYLIRHHSEPFHVINWPAPSVDIGADGYKEQVALVKKGAAVLAEPLKALKADKAADRLFAANVLINKYRAYPSHLPGKLEREPIPAEESKLILKTLAEVDWKVDPNDPNAIRPYQTFSLLYLSEKDGFESPMAKPGEDFVEKSKEAFVKWLAGPGKDYRIKKFVLKKN
jgi:hypothetical protein